MIAVMHHEEPPVYQARYGWTRGTPVGLMLGVAVTALGSVAFISPRLIFPFVLAPVGGVFVLASILGGLIGRQVAFRVDQSGVTLGGNPLWYRATARHIPWVDIQQIKLWTRGAPLVVGGWTVCIAFRYKAIGLVRRPEAPALSKGGYIGRRLDMPAFRGPSDVTGGAARAIGAWNLDRSRLELAVSVFAPGTPVVDLGPEIHDHVMPSAGTSDSRMQG
jgi:hypothetical protein